MLAAAIQASLHDQQQTPEQPMQQPQPEPQQVRLPQTALGSAAASAPAPAPAPALASVANRVRDYHGACRRRLRCRARTAARPPSPSCGSGGSSASRATPSYCTAVVLKSYSSAVICWLRLAWRGHDMCSTTNRILVQPPFD